MNLRAAFCSLALVAAPVLAPSSAHATIIVDLASTLAYTYYDGNQTSIDVKITQLPGLPVSASDAHSSASANISADSFTLTTFASVASDSKLTQAKGFAELLFHVTSAGTLTFVDTTVHTGNTTANNHISTLFEDGVAVVSLPNGSGGTLSGSYLLTTGHQYKLRRDTGLDAIGGLAGSLSGTTAIASVPEASTWAMMLLGFAGIGYAGFRQSKRKAALAGSVA